MPGRNFQLPGRRPRLQASLPGKVPRIGADKGTLFQRWWSPRRWVRTLPPSTGTSLVVPVTSWGDQHEVSLWVLREGWQMRVGSPEVTRQSHTRQIPRSGVAKTREEHEAFIARGPPTRAEGSNFFSPLCFLQHLYSCQQPDVVSRLHSSGQELHRTLVQTRRRADSSPCQGRSQQASRRAGSTLTGFGVLHFPQQKQFRHLYTHSVKVQVNKRCDKERAPPSLKKGLVLGQSCSPQAGQSSGGGCPENATSDAV